MTHSLKAHGLVSILEAYEVRKTGLRLTLKVCFQMGQLVNRLRPAAVVDAAKDVRGEARLSRGRAEQFERS